VLQDEELRLFENIVVEVWNRGISADVGSRLQDRRIKIFFLQWKPFFNGHAPGRGGGGGGRFPCGWNGQAFKLIT